MVHKEKVGRSCYIKPLAIGLLFILLYMSAYSSAKEGYEINVRVSNSTGSSIWGSRMVTETLTFQSTSEISGTGNSSKYVGVSDFAGMNLKDAGYTKQGRLIDSSTMSVASKLNYIHIQENAHENATSTKYNAIINLSIPTVMYSTNDLYYRGDGMSTRNLYTNDRDTIETSLSGKTLTKSVVFGGAFRNAMIFAEVTPRYVFERKLENRTTAFRIMSTTDQKTEFGFKSGEMKLEQDYVGAFQLNTKLIRGSSFDFRDDLSTKDNCGICGTTDYAWLPCCSYDKLDLATTKDYGPSLIDVFDCEHCKISK